MRRERPELCRTWRNGGARFGGRVYMEILSSGGPKDAYIWRRKGLELWRLVYIAAQRPGGLRDVCMKARSGALQTCVHGDVEFSRSRERVHMEA